MNEWMNHEGVCRTATATPGLLNTLVATSHHTNPKYFLAAITHDANHKVFHGPWWPPYKILVAISDGNKDVWRTDKMSSWIPSGVTLVPGGISAPPPPSSGVLQSAPRTYNQIKISSLRYTWTQWMRKRCFFMCLLYWTLNVWPTIHPSSHQ